MTKLHLKRPLIVFDLETTGVDISKDRIVEIAAVKIMPDGQVNTKPEKAGERFLINPEMHIPTETSMIHGIYDEHVQDAPTFKQISKSLYKFMFDCDLGGFNSNKFDIPMLAEEFLRVGIPFSVEGRNLIDAQTIFHLMEQRTLKAAYKFYCDKELEDAHEALPDAMATYEVIEAMVQKYEGVEKIDAKGVTLPKFQNDMDVIHDFCERQKKADLMGRFVYSGDEIVFNFGKYKGRAVEDVLKENPGYYRWMMDGNFPHYTKKVLTDIREEMNSKK